MTPRLKSASVLAAACLLIATARGQPFVEDSIDVGGAWVGSLAYSPAARVVYGRSQESYYFFAISCDSSKVISRIYRQMPMYIAYSTAQNKAYFTQRTGDMDSVIVVDGRTHQYLKGIPLLWATVPVYDSVSDRLYVSCDGENEVGVIDCATDSVIAHIRVGRGPVWMNINSQGRKLYVQNSDGESVSIIDLQTNQVIRTIPVGNVPGSGCYSATAGKYCCGTVGEIWAIDGAGDTVVARIPLRAATAAVLAMTSVESHALVMACGYTGHGDSVFVIDALRDSVVRALPTDRGPDVLLWSRATDLVYCSRGSCDSVSVIRGDGTRVVEAIPVGHDPFVLAVAPELGRVYLGHLGSEYVYVIRDTVSGVSEPDLAAIGQSPLVRVRPNPFTKAASIECCARLAPGAGMCIFSQDGRQVRRLAPDLTLPGASATFTWDGEDELGRRAPKGVYLAVVQGQAGTRAKFVKVD
jgi:YVTN family beta-propeller protein